MHIHLQNKLKKFEGRSEGLRQRSREGTVGEAGRRGSPDRRRRELSSDTTGKYVRLESQEVIVYIEATYLFSLSRKLLWVEFCSH